MQIRVETSQDTLELKDGKIYAVAAGISYVYELSQVEEVVVITTDIGPYYCDMGLAVKVDKETAIFIMSDHNMYEFFLFDQLGKALPIDFNVVIQASMCTENKVFVVYRREGDKVD